MNEEKIIDTWELNARQWAQAVDGGKIQSRIKVTNAAIVRAVGPGPGRLLDLGCGEGWLARALSEQGWEVTGVDGAPTLVEVASASGDQEFLCVSYENLGSALEGREFEKVIANFSLLGETSTAAAVEAAAGLLVPGGLFLLQTLHPSAVDEPTEGWRVENWTALGELSCTPSPWYYRTLESWLQLLEDKGLRVQEIREPTVPGSEQPASIIIVSRRPIPDEPHL